MAYDANIAQAVKKCYKTKSRFSVAEEVTGSFLASKTVTHGADLGTWRYECSLFAVQNGRDCVAIWAQHECKRTTFGYKRASFGMRKTLFVLHKNVSIAHKTKINKGLQLHTQNSRMTGLGFLWREIREFWEGSDANIVQQNRLEASYSQAHNHAPVGVGQRGIEQRAYVGERGG